MHCTKNGLEGPLSKIKSRNCLAPREARKMIYLSVQVFLNKCACITLFRSTSVGCDFGATISSSNFTPMLAPETHFTVAA